MANIKSIHCLLGDKPVVIEAESGYLPEARRVNVIREEVKQIDDGEFCKLTTTVYRAYVGFDDHPEQRLRYEIFPNSVQLIEYF